MWAELSSCNHDRKYLQRIFYTTDHSHTRHNTALKAHSSHPHQLRAYPRASSATDVGLKGDAPIYPGMTLQNKNVPSMSPPPHPQN